MHETVRPGSPLRSTEHTRAAQHWETDVTKLLSSRWFWPGVCSPLLVIAVAMISGLDRPGVIGGLAVGAAWCATIPFGVADRAARLKSTPLTQLAVAGWGLLAVVILVGGLSLAMSLDPTA